MLDGAFPDLSSPALWVFIPAVLRCGLCGPRELISSPGKVTWIWASAPLANGVSGTLPAWILCDRYSPPLRRQWPKRVDAAEADAALQSIRLSLAVPQPTVALDSDEAEAESALPDDPVEFPRPPDARPRAPPWCPVRPLSFPLVPCGGGLGLPLERVLLLGAALRGKKI